MGSNSWEIDRYATKAFDLLLNVLHKESAGSLSDTGLCDVQLLSSSGK